MTEIEIKELIASQRAYYATGATRSYEARKAMLNKLHTALKEYIPRLHDALREDLGKSETESYMCETGLSLSELKWVKSHLKSLMSNHSVCTPLSQFHAHSYQSPSPYGMVLILSPWNYPVLLTIDPLIDALAAGNTVILKPSAYAPATSAVMAELIKNTFAPEVVAMVTGGRAENQALLKQKFDMIFFTGGKTVGREVLRSAAEYLTPVVLELGGKSPCIVDETANIALAAKRIVFGKYLNCGQTCVAPDYVYCHSSVKEKFVAAVKKEIIAQYGENPLQNTNYGKIISEKHFNRVSGLINPSKVVCGGKTNTLTWQIEPTVMTEITREDAVMQEEIFGPLMPIMTYDNLDSVIADIESQPHPLALYMFTSSRKNRKKVMNSCHFGGGCINDVVIHLATSNMPFGGVGESGMGGYHGKAGFETFSHYRSMVDKKTWIDMPIRYQPYTSFKNWLLKIFL